MNPVAKMGFVPRGIYNNGATYDFLDFVYYNGNTYVAKKLTVGNEPQENNEYWQIFAKGGIEDVGIQFEEATERQNIQSGEDAPTLFGKIKKWYADLKKVAFSGSYNDLSDAPAIPAAVAVKGNAESTYRTGNVNLTPNNIGAVATSSVLTTQEQIDANTDTSNVAGATAVKAIKSNLTNSINQINSNLTDGVVNLQIISTLTVPTQLKHSGFYNFPAIDSDVNNNIADDAKKMTDYAYGDYSGLLISNSITSSGCQFGVLMVTSPRLLEKGICAWFGLIWNYKFTLWKKL